MNPLVARMRCAGLVAAVCAVAGCPGGKPLAKLDVSSSGSTKTFTLKAPATIEFWAEVEVTHGNISASRPPSEIPRAYDYAIEVRQGDRPVFQRACNPFDVTVMRWSGKSSSVGKPSGRSYDGRMNGCGVQLEAGTYDVSVKLQPNVDDERVVLKRSVLHVRMP